MILASVYTIFVNANSKKNIKQGGKYNGKNGRKSALQRHFNEGER